MQEWFQSYCINIDALPHFYIAWIGQTLNMTKMEKNRVIELILLYNEWIWISTKTSLGSTMDHYKALYKHISQDGFIINPLVYLMKSIVRSGSSRTLHVSYGWDGQICKYFYGRTDLPIVPSWSGIDKHYVCHYVIFLYQWCLGLNLLTWVDTEKSCSMETNTTTKDHP